MRHLFGTSEAAVGPIVRLNAEEVEMVEMLMIDGLMPGKVMMVGCLEIGWSVVIRGTGEMDVRARTAIDDEPRE